MVRHFLFQPGEWLGAGQVSFSMSPDVLHFRTKWIVSGHDADRFHCIQTVEIVGGDRMTNIFQITPKDKHTFEIQLENELLGSFKGIGLIEENQIAWEFREKGTFEGFEVYKLLQETEYSMHAEYLSSDHTRTNIKGRLWKRVGDFSSDVFTKHDDKGKE